MDTDQTQIKPAPKKSRQVLTCGCLSFLIIVVLCGGVSFVVQNVLPPFQAGRTADRYMNSIKTDKHIQSWSFANRTMTRWTGDGALMGGNEADFSGVVTYDGGQQGTVTMILRNDGFMDVLSQNWRVFKTDFGPEQTATSTP